jgi:hypothetical protein
MENKNYKLIKGIVEILQDRVIIINDNRKKVKLYEQIRNICLLISTLTIEIGVFITSGRILANFNNSFHLSNVYINN